MAEDVHYDKPMRQDLNKKSTVINLLKYIRCIVDDMLKATDTDSKLNPRLNFSYYQQDTSFFAPSAPLVANCNSAPSIYTRNL